MRITHPCGILLVASVLLVGGCTGGGTPTGGATPTVAPTATTAPATTTAATPPASAAGAITPLPTETDAENAAVAIAAKPDGRKWAAGNPKGTQQAAGEPFLVGYYVALYDGATQYTVCVIDGVAVPYFGVTGPKFVKAAKDPLNTPLPPETDRQTAAIATAKAYIASVAPKAQPAGIAMYLVYFPKVGEGAAAGYPSVAVFSAPSSENPFASGGSQFR